METKVQVLDIALAIFKDYEKRWARYEEDVEASYKEGYRPSHCFHGTNLHTDWDPMCGPCEDGLGWFDRQAYRLMAIVQAKQAVREFEERFQTFMKLVDSKAPITNWGKMITWVNEPIAKYQPNVHEILEPQF